MNRRRIESAIDMAQSLLAVALIIAGVVWLAVYGVALRI